MAIKKRVALALPDELDLALSKLSVLSGQPKTAIITEILMDGLPILELSIQAMEDVKKGQIQASMDTMTKFLGEVSLKLNQSSIDFGELKGSLKAKHE